jgi:hypothetical protein
MAWASLWSRSSPGGPRRAWNETNLLARRQLPGRRDGGEAVQVIIKIHGQNGLDSCAEARGDVEQRLAAHLIGLLRALDPVCHPDVQLLHRRVRVYQIGVADRDPSCPP